MESHLIHLSWPALLMIASLLAPEGGLVPPEGIYKLSQFSGPFEVTYWLIRLETKNGELAGRVLDTYVRNSSVERITWQGDRLRIVLGGLPQAGVIQVVEEGSNENTAIFDGRPSATDRGTIRGWLETSSGLTAATLSKTDLTRLPRPNPGKVIAVPPLSKATHLIDRMLTLRRKGLQASAEGERAQLLKEASAAEAHAEQELPKLFQEIIERHTQSPAVFYAAFGLAAVEADKISAAKLGTLFESADKTASRHGLRWHAEFRMKLAEALARQQARTALALDIASRTDKELGPQESSTTQCRILKVLGAVQNKAGKIDEARKTMARLDLLENQLEREYLAALPFKEEPFTGRKTKSDRRVLMEFFTSAQSPFCTSAAAACAIVNKSYKPSELILLQYHVDLPLDGPSPLANAACEARRAYYKKRFGKEGDGIPASFFNGTPKAGGGVVFVAFADRKYTEYRKAIKPLLETAAGAKITASAVKQGDKVAIEVSVADLRSPGKDMRLRLVLAEERIAYTGRSKVPFHRQVVRAFPGGTNGFVLDEKESKHTAALDLNELRKELTNYLDNSTQRTPFPFPNSERPLDFRRLRLVAFVQDDASGEVLQVAQVDVVNK
jgi:hypothetical protein